ncbi:hypothetical protein F6A46_10515 [Tenacibaculum finnmarkense genomovar ulcerans]|uniref:ATP-grasp domain-containing protein n=1 Tax=Tenacibaculum finnmarkense TaxID=2781243 RepID=UPI00187B7FED|nr:hypothetical protein [Tenacibaculum finnmarkense]MBE7688661.1 hypothetical protein [Tenacibaculum finnmarkense genomovar ulcerans]
MKIAIHKKKGSYSDRWIEYCNEKRIDYKIVNAYSNNIIEEVADCDIFLWHHHHGYFADANFAKQLLFSLEQAGKVVFPNFNTGWHFDDKLGQKYLFEAFDIPVAPSYAFYTKIEALSWAKEAKYPKVFKLRGGAGSSNVRLVKSFKEAKYYINRAFSNGFKTVDRWSGFKDILKSYKHGKSVFSDVLKGFVRLFIKTHNEKMQATHKGYIYFQEFIENDGFDYRAQTCGDNCIAMIRYCRKNDFRASGSSLSNRNPNDFPKDVLDLSFQIADKLKLQASALDFVREKNTGKLYLVENSFCYGIDNDEFDYGYFDRSGNWYDNKFNGVDWMIEEVLRLFNDKNKIKL